MKIAWPAALALIIVLPGCSEAQPEREQPPVAVVAQKPQMLPEQIQIEAIGSARAAVSAELFPQSEGNVRAVRFSPGDYVRQGAPLILLDDRRERLAVQAAEVQVREAAQLLARYRRIEDTGALSESQIEAGETALAAARVELAQAQTMLADRVVRAPFSGHIGLTEVDRGDRVSPTTPIAQLDNRSTLYIDFPAPEAAFSRLRPGQVVTVTPFSDPDREIDARVTAVDSAISADRRSYTVRTAVPNSGDRLRPGMSFRVLFTGSGAARPAVPEEAIVWGAEGAYLWAVREGKARRVPVTIASRREGRVLVSAKLQSNERVIVEGVQKVREGQMVKLVQGARPPSLKAEVAGTAAAIPRSSAAPGEAP